MTPNTKPEKPSGYPYADLYQVLAYCTALHLPRGHLIYARGNANPVRHVVRYSSIEMVKTMEWTQPDRADHGYDQEWGRGVPDVWVQHVAESRLNLTDCQRSTTER